MAVKPPSSQLMGSFSSSHRDGLITLSTYWQTRPSLSIRRRTKTPKFQKRKTPFVSRTQTMAPTMPLSSFPSLKPPIPNIYHGKLYAFPLPHASNLPVEKHFTNPQIEKEKKCPISTPPSPQQPFPLPRSRLRLVPSPLYHHLFFSPPLSHSQLSLSKTRNPSSSSSTKHTPQRQFPPRRALLADARCCGGGGRLEDIALPGGEGRGDETVKDKAREGCIFPASVP